MKRILAIVTRPDDPLLRDLINHQKADHAVTVADLTNGQVDYDELLDQIFAADSVQVF